MANIVKLKSVKSGDSADNRKVIDSATTTTAAPATSSDGFLFEGPRHGWVSFTIAGTTPAADVVLWVWDSVSQAWHILPGPEFRWTVRENGRHRIFLEGGPIKVYPQVIAISGAGATLNMWIAEAREEP